MELTRLTSEATATEAAPAVAVVPEAVPEVSDATEATPAVPAAVASIPEQVQQSAIQQAQMMSQLPANGAEGASIPVSVTAVDAKNADASVPHVVAHVPPPCGDAPPPAAATPGSERKRKKKEPRDETKPKKPMSGFLLWMNNPDEKLKIVGGATDMSHKEFT